MADPTPRIIPAELETYAESQTTQPPQHLIALDREARANPQSIMHTGHVVGRLLKILSFTLRPRLAVDVGTFLGNSALCIAEGLPPGGRVVTCEINEEQAAATRGVFQASPYRDRIELRVGNAIDTLHALADPIDLAFIDADKHEYWEYYDAVLDRLAPHGLILVDNTLFFGTVLMTEEQLSALKPLPQGNARAILDFNRRLREDPRTEKCLLTVRDGVTLICRKP